MEKRVPCQHSGSGVSVSRRGVLVTALGGNPDGPGAVLRRGAGRTIGPV